MELDKKEELKVINKLLVNYLNTSRQVAQNTLEKNILYLGTTGAIRITNSDILEFWTDSDIEDSDLIQSSNVVDFVDELIATRNSIEVIGAWLSNTEQLQGVS